MANTANRYFPVQKRGELREDLLTGFARGARNMINPATGAPWTAIEIQAGIAPKSPRYVEADALDLVMQLEQQRALWLADQPRPDRASTQFLQKFHSVQWGLPYLPATGGSGLVLAPCAPGTSFAGSTTLGSPSAVVGTDQNGNRYQVLFSATSDLGGDPVALTLASIDTGIATNVAAGTQITWSQNVPLGTGGLPAETDAQFQKRLARYIRHKEGGGNRAQLSAWAGGFSNAVDIAFVYACPLFAGTGVVAVLPKRAANVAGPGGRIASPGLIGQMTSFLVPPGSVTVPDLGLLLVTGATSQPTDMVLQLQMPTGSIAGWADYTPWPLANGSSPVQVTGSFGTSFPLNIQITCTTPLPAGVTAPQLMSWDIASSSFVRWDVQSVVPIGGNVFNVTLNTPPLIAPFFNQYVSPFSQLGMDDSLGNQGPIPATAQAYFDALGAGELLDVSSTSTDPRRVRAYRFVQPQEEFPYRAGSGIISSLQDALVGSLVDGIFLSGGGVPNLPADPSLGPNLLTLGRLAIYPL